MAQIRLITDERLNVADTVKDISIKIKSYEAIDTGFVSFTMKRYKDGNVQVIYEEVLVNINHIIMYY